MRLRLVEERQDTELTPREREVLMLISQGLSNKRIAHQLGISIGTVKNHNWVIFTKLGVFNRQEATVKYLRGEVDKSRHSETGITIGIVDSLITMCRVLAQRDLSAPEVREALKDLRQDEDLRRVLNG